MNEKPFLLTLSIVAVVALIYVVANKNVSSDLMEARLNNTQQSLEGTCRRLPTDTYVDESGRQRNDCSDNPRCFVADFHGGACQGMSSCRDLNQNTCYGTSGCSWNYNIVTTECVGKGGPIVTGDLTPQNLKDIWNIK